MRSGRLELADVTTDRGLQSREMAERPKAEKPVQASLAERVARHTGPTNPGADHPSA